MFNIVLINTPPFFVADALKLLLKEYIAPTQANIVLFFLGPIITLIFALLGYSVIPYGPGLSVSDLNLGIIYMLAVSSLSTYGILLAGLKHSPLTGWSVKGLCPSLSFKVQLIEPRVKGRVSPPIMRIIGNKLSEFQEILKLSKLEAKHIYFNNKYGRTTTSRLVSKNNNSTKSTQGLYFYNSFLYKLFYNKTTVLFFMAWLCFLYFCIDGDNQDLVYRFNVTMSLPLFAKQPKGFRQSFYTSHGKNNELSSEEIKAPHSIYIKELYKDRKAPVVPFDRSSILATCSHCLDSNIKYEFLKNWGSKGCIYIIEYKHNPLIYYIGRTTLLKRRFNNHLKADSGSKLHVFLNLVGWEHFNISIVEVCSPEVQGARENYYLQKYLPILNTTFSSSFSESAIYASLTSKLVALKSAQDHVSGQAIPTYVYGINNKGISKTFVKYNSLTEASSNEKVARGTVGTFRDTNVPFRDKLYFSKPIIDFELTFNLVKSASKDLKLNSNIAKGVLAYNAKTL